MENNRQITFSKNAYIVLFTIWTFYILQIIIILVYTLKDINYYKSKLYGDLGSFVLFCFISVFITFSITKNEKFYYNVAFVFTIFFEILIIILLILLIRNKYVENKNEDIFLILLKFCEIVPGCVIFFNKSIING